METVIVTIVFLGINGAIWWALVRWRDADKARQDQRVLFYLTWDEATLIQHHQHYCDLLLKKKSRALCLREMETIKAALEMQRRIRSKG